MYSDVETGITFYHFIWYSSSFLPFIDLFTRAYSPREDLKKEFRFIIKWRNKVSALFALVKPESDSPMVQKASVNQYLTWDCGRFSVGREVFGINDPGKEDSTPNDWGWELTAVHERMLGILRNDV